MHPHINEHTVKGQIQKFIVVTAAAMLFAFNLQSFVHTGGLFPGGMAGITLLLQGIASKYFGIKIAYAIIYIPLNLFPMYIGFRYIGKNFTMYSFYFIVLSGILADLFPVVPITYDVLLVSIFGGILNGIALCACLMFGASGGGTDFISIYMSEKRGIDAWNYILLGNICMLVTAGILFGFDRALYSIIYQFCSTQIISTFYRRYQKHTLLIITGKPDEIYEKIRDLTHHDATVFTGIGCYAGVERKMVYSVISSDEISIIMKAIDEVDPSAFINVLKTEQIDGRFYKRPKM